MESSFHQVKFLLSVCRTTEFLNDFPMKRRNLYFYISCFSCRELLIWNRTLSTCFLSTSFSSFWIWKWCFRFLLHLNLWITLSCHFFLELVRYAQTIHSFAPFTAVFYWNAKLIPSFNGYAFNRSFFSEVHCYLSLVATGQVLWALLLSLEYYTWAAAENIHLQSGIC